jgi:HEAT repeat protein
MISLIREWLQSDDHEQIARAEQQLQSLDPILARAELTVLSQDANPAVRSYSAIIAGRLFRDLAVQLAIDLLTDSTAFVRWHACEILHYLHCYQSADRMAQLVAYDPDELVRNRAAIAIGELGDMTLIPLLLQAAENETGTDHEGSPVRDKIIDAVTRIKSRYPSQQCD